MGAGLIDRLTDNGWCEFSVCRAPLFFLKYPDPKHTCSTQGPSAIPFKIIIVENGAIIRANMMLRKVKKQQTEYNLEIHIRLSEAVLGHSGALTLMITLARQRALSDTANMLVFSRCKAFLYNLSLTRRYSTSSGLLNITVTPKGNVIRWFTAHNYD